MGLIFNEDKCIGCKLCRLACSGKKEGVFNLYLSRIWVDAYYENETLVVENKICTLCGGCVDVCPAQALSMEDGRLSFDGDNCINCGLCVEACPEGVILQKEDTIGVCDLCEGDPQCVKICPHGALVYEKILACEEGM